MPAVGKSVTRKEALDKVTGTAKYNDDFVRPELLHAYMVTSLYPHAIINYIEDRPPLARGKVRYFGEPVAVVVAHSEYEA